MAKTAKDITFGVRLEKDGFTRGLKSAENDLKKLDNKVDKTTKGLSGKFKSGVGKIKSSAGGWGKSLAGALTGPVGAAFAGAAIGTAITQGISSSIQGAFDAGVVKQKLQQQLDKVGAGVKLDAFDKLADSIEKSMNIDADDALTGFTKMLQAGISPENVEKVSSLAADMAKATRKSMIETSEAISMALNGDITRLKRDYGVYLDTTGNKAKDAQNALAQLQKTYGGQGAAIASKESPLVQMQFAINRMKDVIGEALIPMLVPLVEKFTAFIDMAVNSGAVEKMMENIKAMFSWGKQIFLGIINGNWIDLIIEMVELALQNLWALIKATAKGILPWLVTLIMKFFMGLIAQIMKYIEKALKLFLPDSMVPEFSKSIKEIADNMSATDDLLSAMGEFSDSFIANTKDAASDMAEVNKSSVDVAEKNTYAAGKMKDAAYVYSKASINGVVSQNAIARDAAKAQAQAQTNASKPASKAAYGHLGKSAYAPSISSMSGGSGGSTANGYQTPYDQAIAQAQAYYNSFGSEEWKKKLVGGLPTYNYQEIAKYGPDREAFAKDYMHQVGQANLNLIRLQAKREQYLNVRLYSSNGMHASMMNN